MEVSIGFPKTSLGYGYASHRSRRDSDGFQAWELGSLGARAERACFYPHLMLWLATSWLAFPINP